MFNLKIFVEDKRNNIELRNSVCTFPLVQVSTYTGCSDTEIKYFLNDHKFFSLNVGVVFLSNTPGILVKTNRRIRQILKTKTEPKLKFARGALITAVNEV